MSIIDSRVARVALSLATAAGSRTVKADTTDEDIRSALEVAVHAPFARARDIHTTATAMHFANTTIDQAAEEGIRVIVPGDDEWPRRLNDLDSSPDTDCRYAPAPLCLWVRGRHRLRDAVQNAVTIVGARAATEYGRHVATDLGYDLGQRVWTVVSGGAYGIDEAAHRGALSSNGVTVCVLACGVDRPFPVSHTGLFEQITATGLIVSEYPPGAVADRHRFAERNRLLAALTCGTVVVEAGMRSGAIHTARTAAKLQRLVMITPGPVTSSASAGSHRMARELHNVRFVTCAADIIADLTTPGPTAHS